MPLGRQGPGTSRRFILFGYFLYVTHKRHYENSVGLAAAEADNYM